MSSTPLGPLYSQELNPLNNGLIVALDVDSKDRCLELARDLSDIVGGLKVGPRLVVRYGSDLISELSHAAPVFLDLKFLDIPSTTTSAVRAAFDAGASLATVHAWAGIEALNELFLLEKELNQIRPFRILIVTILTSFSEKTLPPSMRNISIAEHVSELCRLAYDCGLRSFVCSPHEAALLKGKFSDLFLVTPGVRFSTQLKSDQMRVMGPREAMLAGSTALVVGRPIIEAKQPRQEALNYLRAMYEV